MIYLNHSAEKDNFSLEFGIDILRVVFMKFFKMICNTYYESITFLSPLNYEYEDSVLAKKFDGIAPTPPSEVSRYQN